MKNEKEDWRIKDKESEIHVGNLKSKGDVSLNFYADVKSNVVKVERSSGAPIIKLRS